MAYTDSIQWEQSKQVQTSLVIQLNGGTSEGTNKFTYNGATAKTVNITPASIGAINTVGTALSKSGTTISHANVVTAGNAGPTANSTITAGSSFIVPYISYNAQGHVTASANRTISFVADILRIKAFSATVNIKANDRTDFAIYNIAIDGYTCIGPLSIDYAGSDKHIAIGKYSMGASTLYISVQEIYNVAHSNCQFVSNILFAKSEFVY